MKKTTVLLVCGVFAILAGCSPSREKTVSRIHGLEKQLFAPESVSFDKEKADTLLQLYAAFIKDHPQDTMSPGFLFKSANVMMNMGEGGKAVTLFDQYIQNYPDKPKAAICMFFKAFVYENVVHDLDRARETYLQFMEKYPKNDFVKDAKLALLNLGKSPDALVREFEAKRHADSLRVADSLAKTAKPKKHK